MTTATKTAESETVIPIGPSNKLSITEELWAPFDFGFLFLSPEFWGRGIPHGDGAAVIVIPGFGGSRALFLYQNCEAWLRRIGYRTFPCGIGINIGCPNTSTQLLCEGIEAAVEKTGRGVHLIGHSLGAILGRTAAKYRPHEIASVISVAGTIRGALVHPLVYSLTRLTIPKRCMEDCNCRFHQSLRKPMPDDVARLALFTPNDGVIEPWNCKEETGGQNVEIKGSTHVGLMANRYSYRAIAEFMSKHQARRSLTAKLAVA